MLENDILRGITMENGYTIKEIADKVHRSQQSIYAMIKKNQAFVEEHSARRGRMTTYDEEVMQWLADYYADEGHAEGQKAAQDSAEAIGLRIELEAVKKDLEAVQARMEAIERERDELKERLTRSEEDKRAADERVGLALVALQAEKQEKLLLLPKPKRGIVERIMDKIAKKTDEKAPG